MDVATQDRVFGVEPKPISPSRRPAHPRPLIDPDLSVVIVNHRHWSETARLVHSLRRAECLREGAVEVVVVDNHSPPHPLAGRLRRLSGVSLRRWGRNRGFARAVNEGCRLSRGRWQLLLNPDVGIGEAFVEQVLDVAARYDAEDPRAGIVGLGLLDPDGSVQGSTGPWPTLTGTLARLALPRRRRKYHAGLPRGRCRVPWVSGCGLLARRDCLRDLGGFDEDFFLYYEDVDLCRRAWAQGWSVWHEPAVRAVHFAPLHRRTVPPPLRLMTRHALLTYAAKHWPGWQARLLAEVVRLEARGRRVASSDPDVSAVWTQLEALAGDFARQRPDAARRRLHRVLRGGERAGGR
jgi:GT2 family glycosyltransferase